MSKKYNLNNKNDMRRFDRDVKKQLENIINKKVKFIKVKIK